ncbi:MAG TPA: ferrochelatase [Fimbriimonadaceae bacterium]|jgi:ferrochelatase
MSKLGLLVMHYGTPASLDAVEPYYTHIRRGRPPTPEQLENLVSRYKAIGGPSPLTEVSEKQAQLIQKGFEKRGYPVKLYVGAKHTHPFVAESVDQMVKDGIQKAVGMVLAPHFSTYSIAAYKHYALEARAKLGSHIKLCFLERWGTLPALITALAKRVEKQLEGWDRNDTLVIFSAHSLPEKILAEGDTYKMELLETAELVANKAKIPHWTFAFQSASATGEPWLGPDILDVLEKTAQEKKYKNVVSCTVGFVSDHLEVRYDLGIEAKEKCAERGLNFRLADCINADEPVMDAVAALALTLL